MAISGEYVLAIDLGTSGCKVGLVSVTGDIIAWAFRSVPILVVGKVGAEQNPDDWWNGFIEAAQEILAKDLVPRSSIKAICTSTQGEGTVAVDRHGVALMNAVIWLDMRGGHYLEKEIGGAFSFAGYNAIKLTKWLRLCGGAPALSGKDPFGHAFLIREAFPEIYEKTYKFLNVLDYFNLRLTGRFVATHDSILTSWVTDNRDIDNVRYDDRLIALSGIEREKFPDLVRCTDVIGTLLSSVADLLGLPTSVQVVAGAIDNGAAAIGAGTLADYDAHLYLGSSSWIAAHVPFKKTSVFDQIGSFPCALPSKYLMMAMQSNGASNVAFLKDRIIFHDDGLIEAEPNPDVYKVLDEIGARTPAGADGAMYLPWLFGERCPVDDASLRACLFNLSIDHNRETIVKAVFEGVALNTRWMMKPVTRFLGRQLKELTIIGGGGLSNAWCQVFADVLDIRIRQPAEPMKANARGAAFIGAAGIKLTSLDEAARRLVIDKVYEPNPANRQLYDDRFEIFTDLHRRLTPIYGRLNASKEKPHG